MKKILILLVTLAMCQGNLFGQTENNTSNRFLKAQYFGKVGGNTGSIIFTGTTSGNVTLKSADIAGTYSFTLPSTAGTANYPLLTNGSGVTSWGVLPVAGGGTNITSYTIGDIIYASGATTLSKLPIGTASQQLRVNAGATALEYFTPAAMAITIDSTAITGGGANRILFENSSNQVSESATNFYFQTATPFNHVFAAERTGVITGVANSLFGWSAGKAITTQIRNTYIGYSAGITATGSDGTFIGYNAGNNVGGAFPSYCTAVGSGALSGTSGNQNFTTAIGAEAGQGHNGCVSSVFVGYRAGSSATASYYSVFLGQDAGSSVSNCFSSIAIGYNAKPTTSHQGVLGSNSADGYISDWYFNGVTHTSAYSVVLNASGGSGTNNAGANIIIAGGKLTGNGATTKTVTGDVAITTSVAGASGTTLRENGDRFRALVKYVDIVETTADTIASVTIPTTLTGAGGTFSYTVQAADASNAQTLTGFVVWSAVNEAGTVTAAIGTDNQVEVSPTGTLTGTLSVATSGTTVYFLMDATSSLTQTTLNANSHGTKNFGLGVFSTVFP